MKDSALLIGESTDEEFFELLDQKVDNPENLHGHYIVRTEDSNGKYRYQLMSPGNFEKIYFESAHPWERGFFAVLTRKRQK